MAVPPVLVVTTTPDPPGIEAFTVLRLAAGASSQDLADRLGSTDGGRWLLVGDAETSALGDLAEDVLAGRVGVFGLAGVVVVGSSDARLRDRLAGVPLLEVGEGDLGPAITTFWSERAGRGPEVPPDVVRLLASERVSARTRGIHARRVLADDPAHEPGVLSAAQLATLRVLGERAVPQDGDPIDLGARVEAQLAAGIGDGWRHADLPSDVEAYRAGLDELVGLGELTPAQQDAVLVAVAAGERSTTGSLSAEQLSLWFEDARNDLVRQWVAHPATMARIGYDGLAGGGDGERKQGFVLLGADEREDWEPQMTSTTEKGNR